jgi:hypothetical protein
VEQANYDLYSDEDQMEGDQLSEEYEDTPQK